MLHALLIVSFMTLVSTCVVHEINAFLDQVGTLRFGATSCRNWKRNIQAKSAPKPIAIGDVQLSASKKKCRRPARLRRPRNYWRDDKNLDAELRAFWKCCNVTIDENDSPIIPNESLLNYFERHDLRWAISSQGGRKSVSYRLDGAKIMPGKWNEVIAFCPEIVEELLVCCNRVGVSESDPPLFLQSNRTIEEKYQADSMKKWVHRSGRNPKGYWNTLRVIEELVTHLEKVKQAKGRPSTWMPRPSELSADGRDDLKAAMARFGGYKVICKLAGLVPYGEWQYFEDQFEFLLELQSYLIKHERGSEQYFPRGTTILSNGHDLLYYHIQKLGGRKLLASRLGMSLSRCAGASYSGSVGFGFGPFSLDFAIRLFHFIRTEMMEAQAPLAIPSIQMPTPERLQRAGERELGAKVIEFGGAENVARRLGLGFESWDAAAGERDKATRAA